MSDYNERECRNCGSYLHHENNCTKPTSQPEGEGKEDELPGLKLFPKSSESFNDYLGRMIGKPTTSQPEGKEDTLGLITYVKNLDYMNGTKPQYEFTPEEILASFKDQPEGVSAEGMPKHNEDATVYIMRAIAMMKDQPIAKAYTVAGYNGILSLLGYAMESHNYASSLLTQRDDTIRELREDLKAITTLYENQKAEYENTTLLKKNPLNNSNTI